MSEDSEQSKSEEATPYKLKRARQKGNVARSIDLGFFTTLAAFTGYLWISGPGLAAQVSDQGRQALASAPNVLSSPGAILELSGRVLTSMAQPIAFMAVAIFAVVLAFELVQTGVVFSTEPLRPDFGRMNPAKGLKRIFTLKILIETAKNILKLLAYGFLSYLVVRKAVEVDARTITDAARLMEAMRAASFRLLAFFVLAAVAFAALDQILARRHFMKNMRMSQREVKREHRDREGDARLKQKRKQLHADFVKVSQSLRGVRGADVLITNPTHYAVALRYDARSMQAPIVVARGVHQFALRLKKLAFVYGVTIVESPSLARALYAQSALNGSIPDGCYHDVADIYLMMRDKKAQERKRTANA